MKPIERTARARSRWLIPVCLTLALGCGPAEPRPDDEALEPTVVILIRHAETPKPPGPDPADPELTEAGVERSRRLVRVLGDAGVTRIMSTDFVRTRSTVTPLADALELQVEGYDPRSLDAVAEALSASSGRILVVGHSNTTTALAEALGGDPGTAIDDATEFDRLYLLTLKGGSVTTVLLRY